MQSTDYESTPSFSPDGKTLYFMRADPGFGRYAILQSRCVDGSWSSPAPVTFAATPPAMDADPFVTPDGRRLYFISNRHAPDGEDFDIWFVERVENGDWGPPQRLPAPVNSPASELLPRLDSQGTLYFGSARDGSAGGGDIYTAIPGSTGPDPWQVTRLPAPVNTDHMEYEADISRDGRTLVVVAAREGRSHLYRYILKDGQWQAAGRIAARDDVFQVGPALSPDGSRLLFAQADGARSGEIFLTDLTPDPTPSWPPACGVTP